MRSPRDGNNNNNDINDDNAQTDGERHAVRLGLEEADELVVDLDRQQVALDLPHDPQRPGRRRAGRRGIGGAARPLARARAAPHRTARETVVPERADREN